MAMSNKNWNDRADKDLFFTILSVKNIGVISGTEWTTIGNHMRSLGYGFTNEGCRQHFQGLRRAQNKADANGSGIGSTPDSAKRVDPTLNPITRRPGPGRGRPKKQQQQQTGGPEQPSPGTAIDPASSPGQDSPSVSRTFSGAMTGHFFGPETAQPPSSIPVGIPDEAHSLQEPAPLQSAERLDDEEQVSAAPDAVFHGSATEPVVTVPTVVHYPSPPAQVEVGVEADVDADGAESASPIDAAVQVEQLQEKDEHPAKRLKLEPQDAEGEPLTEHGQHLDDEAVLALAEHNGPNTADHYGPEMPPKGAPSVWQNAAFLTDVALVLYETAQQAGALTAANKQAIEETLRKMGHETSWEAIR
ncbi:hypothetical protein HIM_00233 [Hirsutella minnesotensis 3608]|nr:hypothetical protein HIM_00233 [Hirsutella minnesotensis 3608]